MINFSTVLDLAVVTVRDQIIADVGPTISKEYRQRIISIATLVFSDVLSSVRLHCEVWIKLLNDFPDDISLEKALTPYIHSYMNLMLVKK